VGRGGCSIIVLVVALFFMGFLKAAIRQGAGGTTAVAFSDRARPRMARRTLDDLRKFDPNFSRVVFEDFCFSLFARVHHARGAGDLARYAPFVAEGVRAGLERHATRSLREVRGIVIGAMEVGEPDNVHAPLVHVNVTYDANYTEVLDDGSGPKEQSWYVRERWTFERARDILSPPPARAKAEHCPRCGAALQTRADGSCEYCGVTVRDGSFQWFVRQITGLTRSERGPLLASNVEERGTDLPTVFAGNFDRMKHRFNWEELTARVTQIAYDLNAAWVARDWEKIRPLETDALFQTHRYWIDAYLNQNFRNCVDDFSVNNVEPVKIVSDAFYDGVTFRVWASGRDYTLDGAGKVVAGSPSSTRLWTEYWTLIRTRGADADPSATISCPNCGAAVVVGATGVCSFCSGKLTSGRFEWVLSRIEQDDAYVG
jgi:hypothetical protein